MIFRFVYTLLLASIAAALTSCGTSGPRGFSASSILSGSGLYAKHDSFQLPSVSLVTRAAAIGKPHDKHSMPVYAFSDRTRMVRTTAYTSTEADHLIYGDRNATGTALRYTNRVHSAAADWSFYPVGTTFRIAGMPYLYVVDDYGSALMGTGTIDIYKPSKEIMNEWGTRTVEMTVVQWGSFNRSADILRKRSSYDHCRKMLANIVRQQPSLGRVAKL
ncbi:MAG: 3D domain-containing protein [Akkermansiaceae bacterium]|nr:3D domain-containing protein [Akkermansiaceae bacterium]